MPDETLIDLMLSVAATHGHMSPADLASFNVLRHRPIHQPIINNFENPSDAVAARGLPVYAIFRSEVLAPMRPYLDQETREREAREKHERVIAANAAATQEAQDIAREKVAAKAAADQAEAAFYQRHRALPGPVMPYLISKVRSVTKAKKLEEAERARREARRHQSAHGNLVIKG